VEMPNSVTSIGEWAFYGCSGLANVEIPNSVTSIGEEAFRGCSSLKDVYYSGTEEEWNKISISSGNDYLKNATIHYNSTGGESGSTIYNSGKPIAVLNKDFEEYVFDELSTTRNDTLAYYLCALSRAAYEKKDITDSLDSLGFDINHRYISEEYDATGEHKAAYSLAKKAIPGGTLVLITIRGSLDGGDWYTNFGMGIAPALIQGKHEGFMISVNNIYDELNKFVDYKIGNTEEVTYLITGHSLGAGVGNLLAVKLHDEGVPVGRIYDYNFACPDVAKLSHIDWNYGGTFNNIFNICNVYDPVTQLPGSAADKLLGIDKLLFHWGKFGRTIWFNAGLDPLDAKNNHEAITYLTALANNVSYYNEGDQFYGEPDRTLIIFRCPVDVEIYDEDGNMVVSIINNEAHFHNAEIGEVVVAVNEDQKAISLYKDKKYDIRLKATDEGEMTYEVYDENSIERTTEETKIFENVELTDGKEMISKVGETIEVPDVKLYVVDDNDRKVAEVQEDGTEVEIACMIGDINDDGDVTQTDKLILSRYLAKWDGYASKILNWDAADINGDSDVTQTDKLILSRYLAKWDGYDKYFK
ncbi:MAG: leucine-rich repeat protein, partial [Firmicutes bacterium]|nr:leucine-rich repeat protein [Bacillota bacterium]